MSKPLQPVCHSHRCNRLIAALCVVVAGLIGLPGCQVMQTGKPASDYRTVQANPNRDTQRAKRLHDKALGILTHCDTCYQCECVAKTFCDPCKAEQLLQEALIADVRYGPAHNSLGTLYLRQRKLYLAAWEFEYASGLMPQRPEPINNLGLVYEEAGRLGQAIAKYQEAAELQPANAEYLGNLARASLKQGAPLEEVRYLLHDLRLYETRPDWVAWAEDLIGTDPEPSGMRVSSARAFPVGEGPLLQPQAVLPEELPAPELATPADVESL